MTHPVLEKALFLVDAAGFERNSNLAAEMGAQQLWLEAADNTRFENVSALLIDVDMTQPATMKALKIVLARLPAKLPRVFAVDHRRRIEVIYADITGATGTLRRPFTGAALSRHFFEAEQPAGAVQIQGSIGSAAGALGDLFDGLLNNGAIDMAVVDSAGDEVVEAIGENGLPDWLDTVRSHHAGTFQHCLIVTGVLTTFAQATGMGQKDTALLTRAGLLHDVGKASIPVDILDKPGRLTDAEFAVIRTHPALGFDYLLQQGTTDAELLSAVRGHHEYLDGSGYPDALGGSGLGDLTRIATICDIYGALIERRAYKPPMAPSAAVEVLFEMARRGKVEMPLVRALQKAVAA